MARVRNIFGQECCSRIKRCQSNTLYSPRLHLFNQKGK